MSVTSGFFNSLNGDRKYTAEQFSALLDGLINNGVFANVGDVFAVNVSSGTRINVGSGRAWFKATWLYNDTILPIDMPASEMLLNRYDAIVIEINRDETVRQGTIKVVKGTPSSNPVKPTMTHSEFVDQYPLAYIYREADTTIISQSHIENRVGTSDCPYVTGILQVTNIDNVIAQWKAQFQEWMSQSNTEWDQFTNQSEGEWDDLMAQVNAEWQQWSGNQNLIFNAWFNDLQVILDGDVATNLASRILELESRFHDLALNRAVYEGLQDSTEDTIEDSSGNIIEGSTVFNGFTDVSGSFMPYYAELSRLIAENADQITQNTQNIALHTTQIAAINNKLNTDMYSALKGVGQRNKKYRVATYSYGTGGGTTGEMVLYIPNAGQYGRRANMTLVINRGALTELITGTYNGYLPSVYLYSDTQTIGSNSEFYVYMEFGNYNDACRVYSNFDVGVDFEMTDVTDTWSSEIYGKYLIAKTANRSVLGMGTFSNGRMISTVQTLTGITAPATSTGVDGDYYINTKP